MDAVMAIFAALLGAIVAGILGVLGAIIGGVFAIVGGFLAARYAADRDKEAREAEQLEDFAAAVRVVRYELAANSATLASYLQFGGKLVHDMEDEQFRKVQLVLARRLPGPLRVQVVHAYRMLPFAAGNVQFIASATPSNIAKAKAVIQSVKVDLDNADTALRDYLENTLNVASA
jgi:hypothetical protein